MSKLACFLFGHQPPSRSRMCGGDYGTVIGVALDGIGREHARIYGECPRCEREFYVCSVHLPRKDKK